MQDMVKEEDIKGIFHVHSNYSDGAQKNWLLRRKLGYEYMEFQITVGLHITPMV